MSVGLNVEVEVEVAVDIDAENHTEFLVDRGIWIRFGNSAQSASNDIMPFRMKCPSVKCDMRVAQPETKHELVECGKCGYVCVSVQVYLGLKLT